jgi:hypothetical protein
MIEEDDDNLCQCSKMLEYNEDRGASGEVYTVVVRMDTVRIGFFLGELYGLSCCTRDIINTFFYRKTKQKVCITAGPEFGTKLHDKNLIIDKSLYGLKTSAARFHVFICAPSKARF